MTKILSNWWSNIGEKSGRTDVWVILFVLTHLSCLVPVFLMSIHILEMHSNVYSTQIKLIYFLTGVIATDWGIDIWQRFKRRSEDSPDNKKQ